MPVRTPGRRPWEVKYAIRLGGLISICMLATSLWFLYGRVRMLETPHSPHYEVAHCFDCHEARGSKMTSEDCFSCHDSRSRELLAGAEERRKALSPTMCSHPLKGSVDNPRRTVTALCLSCHKTVQGYVAMVDISAKKYVEIDMSVTHPIGLMPTDSIRPKTLPLDDASGAINCVTCHDPHATDRRLRMLRYYYPGNGRPADFRPLCLDCHPEGWLPLKLLPEAVREVTDRHAN